MTEEWRAVPGWESLYEVSDLGRFRRVGGRVLKPCITYHGYVRYDLRDGRRRKYVNAHRTVWEAFGAPIPAAITVNHINGDKRDNRLANLELLSHGDNVRHAFLLGLVSRPKGEDHWNTMLRGAAHERVADLRRNGAKVDEIARWFGVSRWTVIRSGGERGGSSDEG